MDIHVLGLVELYGDGQQIKFGSKMERCLFAALVMDLGRCVSREELIRRVWGDDTPDKVGTSLNTHVSRLRRRLAEAGEPGTATLRGREQSYALVIDPQVVDLYRFRALVADAAATSDQAAATALLRTAIQQWHGEPLGGLSTDWVVNMRRSLHDEYLQAYLRLVDGELALGRHQELVAELSAQLARNPLDEPLIARLMITYCRCENQAAALICYEEARQRILQELGADPTPMLQALHHQILSRHHASDGDLPAAELSVAGPPDPPRDQRATVPSHPAATRPSASAGRPGTTNRANDASRANDAGRPPGAARRGGVLVGLLALLLSVGLGGSAAPAALLVPCPHPAQLSVTASPDITATLVTAVDQFEEQARSPDGCRLADVTLSPVPSAQTRTALGEGWREIDYKVAPEPDIWIPDSSMDVWLADAQRRELRLPGPRLTVAGPLAHSPVVLAMWKDHLQQPGSAGAGQYRWSDLLAPGRTPIGRPSPTASGVGLVATAALYRAALGAAVLDEPALASPDNLATLRQVERRLVGDDDSSDSLLCPARGPAVPPSGAFLTSEKFVVDHNSGSIPTANCGSDGRHPQLVAQYATDGAPFLDYPFVRVDHPDQPRSRQRDLSVGQLYEFLSGPAARQLLLHSGFRDLEDNVDSAVLPTEKPMPMALPSPAATTTLLPVWAKARRPTNVVLAVDTSAAMAAPFSHVGGTQLTAVADALDLSLRHLGSRDRIGLWQVAGPATSRPLVPLGPAGNAGSARSPAAAIPGRLARLHPAGPAAGLGDAVEAGAATLGRLDPGQDATDAVVLIAGSDADTEAAAPALPPGVQVFVVGFIDPVCGSRVVADLTSATGGACYPIHAAVDVGRAIDRIAAALWGN